MFNVGEVVRDKRTGVVTAITDEQITVNWSDGIERDHPLTMAQDTFEVLDATVDPAPAMDDTEVIEPPHAPDAQPPIPPDAAAAAAPPIP